MADITWDDVVALQSNLDSVSVAAQEMILAYVNEDLNPDAFGGEDSATYTLARAYLAAHLGELARRRGQGGQVQSKTIGTSSITLAYAVSQTMGDSLMQTSWGGAYYELLMSSPLRIGAGSCP